MHEPLNIFRLLFYKSNIHSRRLVKPILDKIRHEYKNKGVFLLSFLIILHELFLSLYRTCCLLIRRQY